MKFLLLPLLLFFYTNLVAQQATIKGTLTDNQATAVGYANVLLLKSADSALVKGMLSDASGSFLFENVAAGRYKVVASMVGYGKVYSPDLEIATGTEIKALAPLVLKQSATTLKEVVVEGQKPLIEQHLDKTVLNVQNSIASAGSTALEVLEKAPGVAVDQNDNISMRGRQGVIVMIDGKPVPMSGTELANMLRGMSANAVEKIELITNPSSKYDAAGNSGIIDIRLKRDNSLGTNGSISSSFGHGEYLKSNQGIQLNHRTRQLNLFGNYNYVHRQDFNKLDLFRQFYNEQGAASGAYDQQNLFKFQMNNHSLRFGADYILSKKTVLGVVANGFLSDFNRTNANTSLVLNAQGQQESSFLTNAIVSHDRANQGINFNMKHTLDNNGREITADVDYITYQSKDDQNFTTNYYNLSNEPTRNPYLLYGNLNGSLDIKSAKVDYTHPLTALDAKLEAGIKSSLVSADNKLAFFDRSNGGNIPDAGKSNHFIYDENIHAAYLNGSKKWEKASVQLGLRLENTIANGKQLTDGQQFDRNYTQLFPSAFLGYKLNKLHEVGMSLSRRINRPSYNQLNPFKNFLDPSTYAAGNPFLKPELSYAFELTHTLDGRFITKLSFSRTTDVMLTILSPDPAQEKLVAQTVQNLARQDYYGLTFSAPFTIGTSFSSMNNATLYYSLYSGNLANTNLRNGRPTLNLNSNNTFTFSNGWSAEVNGVYRGREIYGFLDVNQYWFASAGIQKQLWDKKASLKLNVTDAFFTNRITATNSLTGYVENFKQSRDTRVATLSLTYKFGKTQVAPSRKRTSGAEEESRRAGQ